MVRIRPFGWGTRQVETVDSARRSCCPPRLKRMTNVARRAHTTTGLGARFYKIVSLLSGRLRATFAKKIEARQIRRRPPVPPDDPMAQPAMAPAPVSLRSGAFGQGTAAHST